MDYTTCYCRSRSVRCTASDTGAPVKMHDWQRQGPRFRFVRGGGIVSATTGTAYAGIRTDLTTYLRGATALAEGLSIRATDARWVSTKIPPIATVRAGSTLSKRDELFLRNLHLLECQLDELWTFIHKKEDRLTSLEKLAEVSGDAWVWMAFSPVYKLVPAWVVGKRTFAPCAPPAFSAAIGDRWAYPLLSQ